MTTGAEGAVIDASVAVNWYLKDEEQQAQAQHLLARLSSGQTILAAPVQLRYEVPSAILAAHRRPTPRLSREAAEQAITEFLGTSITTYHTPALLLRPSRWSTSTTSPSTTRSIWPWPNSSPCRGSRLTAGSTSASTSSPTWCGWATCR